MRVATLLPAVVLLSLAVACQAGRPSTRSAAPAPAPAGYGAPFGPRAAGDGAVKVGPPTGTVIVVGGGSMGPEIYKAFLEAAGGPDALILDVPNAGGTDTVSGNAGQMWRNHGAKNVRVLFTKDRRIADSDSFATLIRRARGIWFEGGRQYHLVQDYGGTKAEQAFEDVLARGGVIGGSSAGASILGDFMVRGAPSNDNRIMDYPGYERGFGYLRNVGIDQHVVARSRLADLADSIVTRYPNLLAISEDEGTAWVIRGDTARIIGRNKAFVYNGRDANDTGSPFLTLYPGDTYNLNTRRVMSRVADRSPVPAAMIDSMFARYEDPALGGATVLVAKDGDVYVDRAFGIRAQPRFMPRTTLPQFALGDIGRVFSELCAQMPAPATATRRGPARTPLQECVARVSTPIGAHQTTADSQQVQSSVDELYRLALGLQDPTTWRRADYAKGWSTDTIAGVTSYAAYATPDGKRAALVRAPGERATVIVLTNDANADARAMADRILGRLLTSQGTDPFASPSPLPLHAPQFDRITNADFEPAFAEGMRQESAEMATIAAQSAAPTFDNTIIPLERAGRMLERVQAVFGLLTQANTNDTLQRIRTLMAPRLSAHSDSINMNPALFARLKAIYDQRESEGLTPVQKELVERYYRNFVRAGAQLSDADKARLRAINQESSKLSTEFARKVLSGTRDNALVVDTRAELDGLSEGEIAAAAEAAQRRGLAGKFVIPLQNTTQQPAQASLKNRAVRQRLFDLSVMRNDRGDSNDTKAIVQRLEQLREQKASLLGYPTYAAYALENQMARTPDAAIGLLSQLAPPATAKARDEAARMQKLINHLRGGFTLAPWDWQYYTEQVRQADYDIDQAQVKQYLELDRVLKDGVFYAANKLYGITFRERHDLPVWNPDVRVFDVLDTNGTQLAIFYADYFKRDNKQGGAWMSSFVRQSGLLGDKPVVYNIANLPKPAPGEPALISFDDVHTMFHEFGHALQGMFSNVEYPSLAGTSVPRDFVEMPSQFNEHWALEPSVFANYARHYQSGAPMPANLVDKIKRSATFDQGFATTEYLAAALLDLAWHTRPAGSPPADVNAFEQAALTRFKVNMRDVPPRYHTTYFSHIWSGGYAAAYYAYMWSELIDDDLYYWFREHGGMTRANGERFRDLVLSRGSTKPAGQLFRDFRGRDPIIAPLLEERGLKRDVLKGREP